MIKNFIIPSSVTLIREYAFAFCYNLHRIEIPNDSKLQTIDKNAFIWIPIESLTISSELVDLKDGWCDNIPSLTKISVSPYNPRYCLYDNNMIIGKTRIEQSNYDCLVFCIRNIKHIKIPGFIEHICSYSFNCCKQLESIVFSNESKLQTIGYSAFSFSMIKNFIIPSSVTIIGEYAFNACKELQRIEISNNSKLQSIDKGAFSHSKIKSITIPSSVTFIGENAFLECGLIILEINNPELLLMYCFKDYENAVIMIPFHS